MSRTTGALAVAIAGAVLAWQLAARAQAPAAPSDAPVTFRLIVVSSESAAREVAERLRRGADADTLAAAESIDPSAARGGLIGPVSPAELRAELRDALAALTPGAISGVIRLPIGFGVVQLAEPRSGRRLRSTELGGVSAAGAVQPTVSVDGFAEANTILQEFPKASDDWNMHPQQICDARRSSLREMIASMTELTASMKAPGASPAPDPIDVIQADVILGQIHAYDGRMAETIARFEQAYPGATKSFPEALAQLEEMLGIAHLHKAEMDNGAYRSPGDRCLLSPKPAPLADPRGARTAIDYFNKALARRSGDGELTWLLNLAHMAAGSYPAGVPAAARIPPSALESTASIGRFTDVAPALGLDSFSSAGGVIVDDFDNDGALEILTSNFDSCGTMQLFRRGADGRFHDQAARAGLAGELGGLNLVQADYDNDGCKDVLVLRGGWEQPQRKSLLRNNCNGTFADVTAASGLASPATSTQTAVWADVDNDGFVDLFVGNENRPSQLFRNRGNGTFEDIAPAAGVARTAFTKGVASADYDRDGDVDFYLSNLGGGNFLYRNNGNRTFTEVADQAGVPGPERGFPTWFFDYDNDGWDDLLVTSYFLSVDETARRYLGRPPNAGTMKLYRNQGDGTFADVTAQVSLDRVYMPMGSNFGDVDNDGYPDIYLGTGSPSYAAMVGAVLLHNRPATSSGQTGRSFADVTVSSGTGELHKGHGVAFADIDSDGDLDIVFKVGGATPGDAHAFRLFANPGHGRDWLGIDLVGTRTNRAALGARIAVTVQDAGGRPRTIHRTVSSGGSFGASPLQQHIGLGAAVHGAGSSDPAVGRVDIEISWPASGTTQRFANVPRNTILRIREGDEQFSEVKRAP
jgi:hypothetical protein